jgi:zinc protease
MTVRTRTRLVALLSLLLAGFSPARAQGQPPPNPALGAKPGDQVPVDPRIRIGYLANGLRYYIRVNPRPYRRAELRLAVNAGSVLEDGDQRGLAHFVEHMAFNGSRNFPKQDLVKFMESIGMRLGPGVNADTSFDETVYMLHVPTDNAEAMQKAFVFLSDVAHGLSFDPDAIDRERAVIVEEWRMGRGAEARMLDVQAPVLLRNSRYGERLPIGSKDSIEGVSPDALKRFYADWYRPDLMAVVAVGDFNPAEVERQIKDVFGAIEPPAKPRPRPAFEVPDHPETLFAVATDPEATSSVVAVYNMLPLRDQTTVGAYRQQQVERVYTGMMNARLSELAMRANPPFLRAGTNRGLFVRTKEAATLMALVSEQGIERGLEALVTESARAARFGFTAAELEREKRDVLSLYENAFAERDKEESADLAAEFIRNFTQKEPLPGITYEFGMVQRFLPEITLDEVNQVAKAWAGGSRVVLVNAPRKPGQRVPSEAELSAAIRRVSTQDIGAYVDVASSQPLLARPPEPGRIVNTTSRTEFGLAEWELSNGVRVVLRPTQFKQDEVVFRATSPGGTSLANDADFVAASTAGQVIGAGGLGPFDAIQLRNALAGKSGSVTAYIGDSEEGLAGGASPKDLETMFQLIYLSFTQPRADATVFKVLTDQMKAVLASQQASPEWVFRQTLRTTLAQNHPRARPMTPESVKDMDLQKSYAFYKDRFADASDFTFVFAGSFDLATIKPLVERYLGSLPALRRKETWRNQGITPPRGVVEKTVRKGIEPKGQVAIVFSGSMSYDPPSRVALDALSVVLETRLRERLREALGGTYGAQVEARASRIPEPRYGVTIEFGCAPERTEELVRALFREIEALQASGPSDKEVSDAREALLRGHESDMATNPSLVAAVSAAYENAENLSVFFGLPAQYASLSAAVIREAARRYLDAANYVRVTLLPEERR